MVNGITFSEQLTTSADFAHFQNTFLNHSDGITKGCDISQADGNVYIQKGYFVVCGRFVRVVGVETIPTPDVLSGKLYCKVVFEVDLTKVNTPEEFRQGYFRVLSSAEKYQEATQEDLDGDGTLYQMEWCQFTKGVDGISEWRDLRPIMNLDSIWEAVSGQNQLYKGEFDTYFAGQKTVIERMITELEEEGYVLLTDARRITSVVLPVANWSAAPPYTQTVAVEGLTAGDNPILVKVIPTGATPEQVKAYNKAFGMIDDGDTADGQATFRCFNKKPAVDMTVGLKGV